MNELHVVINLIDREYSHTPPTNMRLALGTSHMVAPSVLLDQYLALRALLDVLIPLGPTLQQSRLRILMYLPLLAAEPVMVLPTGHTNGHEARSAPENPVSRI